MDSDSWLALAVLLGALVLLLLASAAEASLIYLSRTRVWSLVGKNVPHAQVLERYIRERHAVLAVLALTRSMAVVAATVVFSYLFLRLFEPGWGMLLLAIVVGVVVFAELEIMTRVIVAGNPERTSLILAPGIWLLRLIFSLPARLLEMPGRLVLRLQGKSGYPPSDAGESSELLRLVELEQRDGGFEEEERQMIRAIVELEETTAREIMVPRIDIVAVDTDATLADVIRLINERGYSRIPLYEETIDNIIGIIYAKDLLRYLPNRDAPKSLKEIARPPYFIPESKKLDELLTEMRQSKVHMAIVVDEYGGTAGLVTIEDLLEEIVGEIEDEYDVAEVTMERVTEDEAILDARVSIDALNELFGLQIESEDFDTVGGFVYTHLGTMPTAGDEVRANGLVIQVLSVTGNRIRKVRVARLKTPDHPQEQSAPELPKQVEASRD